VVGIFAYNFTVTLPLVTRITFHARSASDYGVLMAAMGFGAVVGGLLIAYRARPTASLLALITLAFGASMTLLSFAPSLPWAALTLVPTGASSIALIATANALLQTNSSQEMRGRVMSLYAIAFLGTTPIGSPLLGLIIRVTNPQVGLLVGAGSALATGAVLAYAAYHRPSTRTALTS